MALLFKGVHFPRAIILHAVFFYLRYSVSYRDLEEIMADRGVRVDHATLNRWVERYAGQVAEDARRRKQPTDRSWRRDETYIRVKGQWVYLYRAVDKFGKTLDFMLSKSGGTSQQLSSSLPGRWRSTACPGRWSPTRVPPAPKPSGTSTMLKRFSCPVLIEMIRVKYLNNLVEEDHCFIKLRVRPMLGFFKSFTSAVSTIGGVEIVNMIRKGQSRPELRPFQQFYQLAA